MNAIVSALGRTTPPMASIPARARSATGRDEPDDHERGRDGPAGQESPGWRRTARRSRSSSSGDDGGQDQFVHGPCGPESGDAVRRPRNGCAARATGLRRAPSGPSAHGRIDALLRASAYDSWVSGDLRHLGVANPRRDSRPCSAVRLEPSIPTASAIDRSRRAPVAGVAGTRSIRTPVASRIAPRIAGAVGMRAGSPTPFAPYGPVGSASSMSRHSISGTSPIVGIR